MTSVRFCFAACLSCAFLLAACGGSPKSSLGEIPEDGRTVLAYGGEETLQPSSGSPCGETFNATSATETVTYESVARGMRFDLPYDPQWGNAAYAVPAYEQIGADTVHFGPVVKQGAACDWVRAMRLEFVPARSAPEVAAQAKMELLAQLKTDKLEIGSEPQVLAAPAYTAVESLAVTSVCRQATLEIVGPKFNVRISMCGRGAKRVEDFQPLRAIAKTMAPL